MKWRRDWEVCDMSHSINIYWRCSICIKFITEKGPALRGTIIVGPPRGAHIITYIKHSNLNL